MNDESYQPVDCADYDIYEIAIMRNRELNIEWALIPGELRRQRVRPKELKIIDGAEYLLFVPVEHVAGDTPMQKIRLDRIKQAEILDNH